MPDPRGEYIAELELRLRATETENRITALAAEALLLLRVLYKDDDA